MISETRQNEGLVGHGDMGCGEHVYAAAQAGQRNLNGPGVTRVGEDALLRNALGTPCSSSFVRLL